MLPWQPSVDGTLLQESPYVAIASGRVRPVPTIIGTNRDEWRLFLLGDRYARSLDDGTRLPVSIAGEDLVRAITRSPAAEYLLLEEDGSVYGVLATADVDRAFRDG